MQKVMGWGKVKVKEGMSERKNGDGGFVLGCKFGVLGSFFMVLDGRDALHNITTTLTLTFDSVFVSIIIPPLPPLHSISPDIPACSR